MDTKKTCQNRQNTKARPKVSESTHNSYYRSNTDLGNFIVTSHSYNFGTTSLPYSGTTSPEFKRRFENLADASLPLLINIDQEMKSPEYIKSILKSPGDSKGRSGAFKKVQFTSFPEIEVYSVLSSTPDENLSFENVSLPNLPEKTCPEIHNKDYRYRLNSVENFKM